MAIIFWILGIVVLYLFLVFVLLRLVTPFMGFKQYQSPKDLPEEMKETISRLEAENPGAEKFLQAVYDFSLKKWRHQRFSVVWYFFKLFREDFEEIWRDEDFAHCNHIGLMANMIISNSKFFKADDIKIRHVFLNFVPHQYLQIKLNNQWIDFDPAGAGIRGKPLGTHQSWFG